MGTITHRTNKVFSSAVL